jgi:hypothetical protein
MTSRPFQKLAPWCGLVLLAGLGLGAYCWVAEEPRYDPARETGRPPTRRDFRWQEDDSGPGSDHAAALRNIDRSLPRQPVYRSRTPKYCLLAFGPRAKHRVWLVLDGQVLYVDRQGRGDLTARENRVPFSRAQNCFSVGTVLASRSRVNYTDLVVTPNPWEGPGAFLIGVTVQDRYRQNAGNVQRLAFAARPPDAPVVHFHGPLTLGLWEQPELRPGKSVRLNVALGTPGRGAGTFAWLSYQSIPKTLAPVVRLRWVRGPGRRPVTNRVTLTGRC